MSSKRGKQSAEEGVETTDVVDDATTEAGTAGRAEKGTKSGSSPKAGKAEKASGAEKSGKADKGATAAVGESTSTRRGDRPKKQKQPKLEGVNPTWWAPMMLGLMVIGLIWIVAFYLGSDGERDFPIPSFGYGNLAIGFGLVMAGFLMTTRWK